MILKPVLYDFKRSIFKTSTIIILTLAILAGLGITWGFREAIETLIGPPIDINFMGSIILVGDSFNLHGVVLDSLGNPLKNVEITVLWSNTTFTTSQSLTTVIIAETRTDENGVVNYTIRLQELPLSSEVLYLSPHYLITLRLTSREGIVETKGIGEPEFTAYRQYAEADLDSRRFRIISFKHRSPYTISELASFRLIYCNQIGETTTLYYIDSTILDRSGDYIDVVVYGFQVDLSNGRIAQLEKRVYYNVSNLATIPARRISDSCNTSLLKYVEIGFLNNYWAKYSLRIPSNIGVGNIAVGIGNSLQDLKVISTHTFTRYTQSQRISMGQLAMTIQPSIFFFTISVIFLCNTLMAKPRGSGELEFILSGPVTRRELFITRYIAGVVTILAIVTVFMVTFTVSSTLLLNTRYNIEHLFLLFTGLLLSLTAFLSILYSIGAFLRPGWYLGLAITLYMLFVLMWTMIISLILYLLGYRGAELLDLSRSASYFNPLIPNTYFISLLQEEIAGVTNPYNPQYVAISTVLWITSPLVLAYYRFKKIPLYT